jgi:hypothetical protein
MKRRTFFGLFGIGAASSLGARAAGAPADMKPIADMQSRWQTFLAPRCEARFVPNADQALRC